MWQWEGAARRAQRTTRIEAPVGQDAAPAALDLLELVEFAWHDFYGDVTPGEDAVEDILTYSRAILRG
ncbi:hypothetical protein [Streptomyces sp. NPDC020362]|uniref:hypothetical protein n=1 Tax=unclassified Streptomyces TaxID=2593676 RepID=UPI00340E601E